MFHPLQKANAFQFIDSLSWNIILKTWFSTLHSCNNLINVYDTQEIKLFIYTECPMRQGTNPLHFIVSPPLSCVLPWAWKVFMIIDLIDNVCFGVLNTR